MQMLLGIGFGAIVVLVALALLWRSCWDCCKRSERYAHHRAFVKRLYVAPPSRARESVCGHA